MRRWGPEPLDLRKTASCGLSIAIHAGRGSPRAFSACPNRASPKAVLDKDEFEPQLILMAVGWYLRFSLSYRDVEELLQERGMSADPVTVWRWVQRYAPNWTGGSGHT